MVVLTKLVAASAAVLAGALIVAGCTPNAPSAAESAAEPPLQEAQEQAPPAEPAIRVYGEREFKELIAGKSREEVIATLGRPLAVNDSLPEGAKSYDYSPAMTWEGDVSFRVRDDVTGIQYKFVSVHFDPEGYVTGVNF